MFSLIKYDNNTFSVVQSKNVKKLSKNKCVVKYNGGKYSAFLFFQNDDKSKLLDKKRKKEEEVSSLSNSKIEDTKPLLNADLSSRSTRKSRRNNMNLHEIEFKSKETEFNQTTIKSSQTPKFVQIDKSLSEINFSETKKSLHRTFDKATLYNPDTSSMFDTISPMKASISRIINGSKTISQFISTNKTTGNNITFISDAKSLDTNTTTHHHNTTISENNTIKSKYNNIQSNSNTKSSTTVSGDILGSVQKTKALSLSSIINDPKTNSQLISINKTTGNNTTFIADTKSLDTNTTSHLHDTVISENSVSKSKYNNIQSNSNDMKSSTAVSGDILTSVQKTKALPETIDSFDFNFDKATLYNANTSSMCNTISPITAFLSNSINDPKSSSKFVSANKNTGNNITFISDAKSLDTNTTTHHHNTTISENSTSKSKYNNIQSNSNTKSSTVVSADISTSFQKTNALPETNKSLNRTFDKTTLCKTDISSMCGTNSPIKAFLSSTINDSKTSSQFASTNNSTFMSGAKSLETNATFNLYSSEDRSLSFHSAHIPGPTSSTNENTFENSNNFVDIDDRSAYEDKSSHSEYIPDCTASTSKATVDNSSISVVRNKDVTLVDAPLNVNQIVVPYAKTSSKKHFCIFCKQLKCKIGRHLLSIHKKEVEVKKALALPKKSKERSKIIEKLRKQGDFEHNTSAKHNTGVLIVSRQQQSKCKNKADDYVCCKICKGFFSKRTIRLHAPICGIPNDNRSNFIESRRLTQYIHPVANKALKTQIFPVLRNDDVTKSVRYDELVIKFGNKLAEKYTSEHQHDMIRANLRLLGRFVIELRKLDVNVKKLKEIFKPNLFDKCVAALRNVANWDEKKMWFNTPAVAQNFTSLIKKCGKKQRAEFIKSGEEDSKTELENFLLLWEEEIPTLINKKAVEDQANKRRIKKIVLPSKEDIQILHTYLKDKIINAMQKLEDGFSFSSWEQLVQATLVFIQLFNRRRPGEIERLTIENFENREQITDRIDKDILKNVSQNSLRFAKQFVRISLRGKLGRTVSVLLCPMSLRSIQIILKLRVKAGISTQNKYIFAKSTTSDLTKAYYSACILLRKFSEACGAKIPETLRGTTLRKHIATYTSLLNIEEATVDKLANFMGHHKDIHKSIYRMSVPVAEITCVSKLLLGAVGDEVEDNYLQNEKNDFVEEAEDSNVDEEEDDGPNNSALQESTKLNHSSTSSKKRRSTSPFGKTKRVRWSVEERQAIVSAFGDLKKLEKLPSLEECSAIRESSVLTRRTPQQIKSWIDNQRRYKINKNT